MTLAIDRQLVVPMILRKCSFEDHIGLVIKVLESFSIKGKKTDSEEYADGLVGLWNAIENFNPSYGYKFSTFAHKCIKNEINRGIRYRRRLKRSLPFQPLEEIDLASIPIQNKESSDLCVKSLMLDNKEDTPKDRRDKLNLKQHYLEGKSWEQIGKENNKTRVWAMQRGQRAIELIRHQNKLNEVSPI